jgi:hypothetical protein
VQTEAFDDKHDLQAASQKVQMLLFDITIPLEQLFTQLLP